MGGGGFHGYLFICCATWNEKHVHHKNSKGSIKMLVFRNYPLND